MSSVALKACALACMFVAIALAQSVSLPPMDHLKVSETLRAAKLSSSEIKQICEQLQLRRARFLGNGAPRPARFSGK